MKKKILSISISLIAILLFGTICTCAVGSGFSWYCAHKKGHVKPKADPRFDFIEGYDGYYIDSSKGENDEDKVIYLTFDAGYENGNIEKTLDALKSQNVKGAFFILGNLVKSNPDLVKRMFEEGHLVCNHTYSHKSMVNRSQEEIEAELLKLENECFEATGYQIAKYYRPPEGRFDEDSLRCVSSMGYKTVFWSFAYADWDNNKQMPAEKAKAKIMDNIHNGEVMLLHPTSATNAEIIEDIIVSLKSEGYRFGTLDELCGR